MHPKVPFILLLALGAGCATPEKVPSHAVGDPIPSEQPFVYDISQVDVIPISTYQARPRYPTELRRRRIGGESTIIFTIRADGIVTDASVVKATDAGFGEAALEAVLKWRFRPARVRNVPVDCRMMVPIVFSLNES